MGRNRTCLAIGVIQSNMLTRQLSCSLRQRPPRSLVMILMTALRSWGDTWCSKLHETLLCLGAHHFVAAPHFVLGRHLVFKTARDTSVSRTQFFTR